MTPVMKARFVLNGQGPELEGARPRGFAGVAIAFSRAPPLEGFGVEIGVEERDPAPRGPRGPAKMQAVRVDSRGEGRSR